MDVIQQILSAPELCPMEQQLTAQYLNNLQPNKELLLERKEYINSRVLQHQELLLPDIIAFNDAAIAALHQVWDDAHLLYDRLLNAGYRQNEFQVLGVSELGEYPAAHPIKNVDARRDDLWAALCDTSWNPIYGISGIALGSISLPRLANATFDDLTGLNCPPPNWNEGLDRELTKNLHLYSGFHQLFEHTVFAITDFIYCRHFVSTVTAEFEKEINAR